MLRRRRRQWRELLDRFRSWALELCRKLDERGVRVEEVILFGSYARGDYEAGSDLDLLVVSSDWKSIPYPERLSLLYKLWDKDIDADFIALTPDELRERLRDSVTLRDASRYWITLCRRGVRSASEKGG